MHVSRRGLRGALLSTFVLALPLVGGAAGCRRADEAADGEGHVELGAAAGEASRELGRTYTAWLEKGDHGRLWGRFGPEMRRAFGTPDSLRTYLDRTVAALGPERGSAQESLQTSDTVRVYTRVASFEKSARPMMLQWTLDRRGMITGFFLRPQPTDSARADREPTAGAPVPAGAASPAP
jgi:hypothetical protein